MNITPIIIVGIIALAIGFAIAYFMLKSRNAGVNAGIEAELSSCRKECDAKDARITELKKENSDALEAEKRAHATELATLKAEHAAALAMVKKEHAEAMSTLKQEHANAASDIKREYDGRIEALNCDFSTRLEAEQKRSDEQRDKELSQLRESYEEQLSLFKEQITTLTEKFLKERSGELQEANTKKMDELFRPLKDDLERMEKSMTEHRVQNAKTTAGFEQTIKQMMESNERLGREADRLSTALQKKNKVVGNWGELILSELLESQGLQEGVHYDLQHTLKDAVGKSILNEETGQRMVPDVILHLADNRDVVIDSKMSLTAFIDYQNAESEEERVEALRRHLASVRNHVQELVTKDYSSYICKPRMSSGFVLMFVPIDGALQLAMSADPGLWREAFNKKVFIVGGQTLMATLFMIDFSWVNVIQQRNTQQIMEEARKLINRVSAFYEEYRKVGEKLEAATKAYNNVEKRVSGGAQSILATGQRMELLGARGKKSLTSLSSDSGPDMLPEE